LEHFTRNVERKIIRVDNALDEVCKTKITFAWLVSVVMATFATLYKGYGICKLQNFVILLHLRLGKTEYTSHKEAQNKFQYQTLETQLRKVCKRVQ